MSDDGHGTVAGQVLTWDGARRIWAPIVFPPPGATSSIIPYAPAIDVGGLPPSYIGFGAISPNEDLVNFVCPRAGVIQNLRINITINALGLGGSTTFRIRRSASCNVAFVNTAIVIGPIGTGVTGCFDSGAALQVVAPGDRISLEVSNTVAAGFVRATGGVEYL